MKEKFNFIYCLAGKGKRFTDKNIIEPKYLLKLDGNMTILEKSLDEFNFSPNVRLFLVINEEHKAFVPQIEELLSKQGNFYKVIVTPDTEGQAETGFIGCSTIENDDPIFFFNGDTILKNRDLSKMSEDLSQKISGAIDVFIEDRDHFSFVKLSKMHLVEEIAEKVPISRYATTGLYGFSNKDVYIKYYNSINTSTEKYISDVYKFMITNNEKIKGYIYEDERDTIILGTPEEYFSNRSKL